MCVSFIRQSFCSLHENTFSIDQILSRTKGEKKRAFFSFKQIVRFLMVLTLFVK